MENKNVPPKKKGYVVEQDCWGQVAVARTAEGFAEALSDKEADPLLPFNRVERRLKSGHCMGALMWNGHRWV